MAAAVTADPGAIDAVVLRTTKYGEADVIAHVLTAQDGRRGVIAKGARKPGSRLGVRLEPFLAVRLQLRVGRGELAIVRGVEVVAAHERVRASWQAQRIGADALELMSRITVEHEPAQQQYALVRSLLAALDSVELDGPDCAVVGQALLAAYELKLLWVVGILPQLRACVRCGAAGDLAAFSAHDGGVTCAGCRRAGDAVVAPAVLRAADVLLHQALADVARSSRSALPDQAISRSIVSQLVAPTCIEHAGVRPRTRS